RWRVLAEQSQPRNAKDFNCGAVARIERSEMRGQNVPDVAPAPSGLLATGRRQTKNEKTDSLLIACICRRQLLRALFFSCFPLFLRRRFFSSLRKALHCNWRAFSPVNRLYFSEKFSDRRMRLRRASAARSYAMALP